MHIGAEAARVHNRHSNQMLYPSYPTTKKTRGMLEVFSKKKLSHPVDDENLMVMRLTCLLIWLDWT
jgi:hypothetical protein